MYHGWTERIFIRRAGAAGGLSGEIDSVIGEIQGELLNRQKHGKKKVTTNLHLLPLFFTAPYLRKISDAHF